MTISRITTWVDGQVLTAAALNNEFDNLISNATALISPLTGTLNANLNQITNLVLEQRSGAFPTTVTPGRLFYDTTYGLVYLGISVSGATTGFGNSTAYVAFGPTHNLSRVRGLSGSLISNIGSFAADGGYVLSNNGAGQTVTITATSSFNINTQTVGPIIGGRDQAAAFASTDVHFYAGVQSQGSTQVFGICSSTPPPVGPTGFSYWAYLGSAKYNVATSAVTQPWIVRGSRIHPQSSQGELLDIIFDTSERLKITTSAVPTIATNIDLLVNYGVAATAGGINALSSFRIASESSPAGGYPIVWQGALGSVLNGYSYNAQSLTLPNTGLIAALTVMSTGQGGLGVMLNSYTVPNGDN